MNAKEQIILLLAIGFSTIGTIWIVAKDWKRYGLLYLISSAFGEALCYLFVKIGFYSFPYRLFPQLSPPKFSR